MGNPSLLTRWERSERFKLRWANPSQPGMLKMEEVKGGEDLRKIQAAMGKPVATWNVEDGGGEGRRRLEEESGGDGQRGGEGRRRLEEESSCDGQPRRNLWREVVVVEEEKKELKSEAGDRFLSSEPGFRGTPKACDLFPARGPNASRLGFGAGNSANSEGM